MPYIEKGESELIMMYFILILMVVFVVVLLSLQETKNKDNNVLFSCTTADAIYCGGFEDIEGGKKTAIGIYKEKIQLFILKKNSNYFDGYTKIIDISKIKNAAIKSETQVQSEIGLGKMLIFGVFALAMKNKRTTVNNYVIIDYYNGDSLQSIALSTSMNEKIVQTIKQLIKREEI
jgi:F0F1-type ATP synthase membrane subunit a